MTKAIMVRAHQIARTCTGDYAARLAIGLRQAWMESRLVRVGNESTSYPIIGQSSAARLWYDMLTGQLHSQQISGGDLYHIVQGLMYEILLMFIAIAGALFL